MWETILSERLLLRLSAKYSTADLQELTKAIQGFQDEILFPEGRFTLHIVTYSGVLENLLRVVRPLIGEKQSLKLVGIFSEISMAQLRWNQVHGPVNNLADQRNDYRKEERNTCLIWYTMALYALLKGWEVPTAILDCSEKLLLNLS